ncbi:hypothetical protein QUF75_03840 [Desulfococcaceae bacterium HSG7]|nr:hypothetical protein [Desulfococcaceae bacterium HSG7]
MKQKCLSILLLLTIFSSNSYAQINSSKYRMIAFNFKLTVDDPLYLHFTQRLPDALEPEISQSCSGLIETLERAQMQAILDTIEYQYSQPMFNTETIAKLKKLYGANVVLIGKITAQREQLRIDTKLVEIETSRRLAEEYIIVDFQELQNLRGIAKYMKKLARQLCNELSGIKNNSSGVKKEDKKNYYEKLYNGNIILAGRYTDDFGGTLDIEKTKEASQYIIKGNDKGGYRWEGVGFYSIKGNYIKSVFRYTSYEDSYGDHVGYHKYDVKKNGNFLVRYGGWNSIDEFGKGLIFTRSK